MDDDLKAESAEDIIRRWANWIIDVSADMEGEDHAAGKRKVRAERDLILSERRKMVEALEAIAASAPAEKPAGPDYDCGNSGDIAWEAQQLAEWHLAQIARAALSWSREQ